MRLIGNKTHGDLAEIGIAEFVNQFMYDYQAKHVGKDLFRSKSREEDIVIQSEMSGATIPVSLKAYGAGPLQLSTDKASEMFKALESRRSPINSPEEVQQIISAGAFLEVRSTNVLPLIYDEQAQRCNIMVFDIDRAFSATAQIVLFESGSGRKHPVFRFLSQDDSFIMEVRYGGATANALQRGLWTHTKNAASFFTSITSGWIDYSHNLTLVTLFGRALVASETGHLQALSRLDEDIERLKKARRDD